jgi:hypothetical protein
MLQRKVRVVPSVHTERIQIQVDLLHVQYVQEENIQMLLERQHVRHVQQERILPPMELIVHSVQKVLIQELEQILAFHVQLELFQR